MEAVASKTKVERRKRVLRAALLAAVAVARRIKGGPAGRSGETLKLTWSRAVSSNASMAAGRKLAARLRQEMLRGRATFLYCAHFCVDLESYYY